MDLNWTSDHGRRKTEATDGEASATTQLRWPDDPNLQRAAGWASSGRLVLSVAETAEALGISDDLVYELMHRGQLPCLHFGRRKVVPRRAIDLVIAQALSNFDPAVLVSTLAAWREAEGEPGAVG